MRTLPINAYWSSYGHIVVGTLWINDHTVFFLCCNSSAKMSEEDNERLLQQHGTLLRVLVSTLKMEFVTNKDIKVL